ncbi:MAG: PorP/SprF family type IX secretion system membrane protein [Bacteroidales bacterium]|nr:PorP/SprF family type IX secretion system membrane protein [Bacteroidales bacterium]
MSRSIPAGIVLLFLFFACHGQETNKNYPVQSSQFMYAYSLINPSSIGINSDYEVLLGYQRPVSGFTGLSTYYCNLSFVPYKIRASAKSKNIAGLRFFNDNEGAYINRMRFYGMYAFHTRINSRLSFAGGIEFGGMNFSVKATPTTEGASVFKADANTGIWVYNEKFHVGFSVNQLFNSVFQPIDERTVLPTHLNLTGSYVIVRNDIVELRPHLLITYPYYSTTDVQAGLHGLFLEKIIASVSWNHKTSVSAMLGVNDLNIYKSDLNIILSYVTNTGKAALGINKLEISILYSFR